MNLSKKYFVGMIGLLEQYDKDLKAQGFIPTIELVVQELKEANTCKLCHFLECEKTCMNHPDFQDFSGASNEDR